MGKKEILQQGKSGWAIFGTQNLGPPTPAQKKPWLWQRRSKLFHHDSTPTWRNALLAMNWIEGQKVIWCVPPPPPQTLPSPVGSKSAGNKDFIQKFRSMVVVREQAWIRELHAGFPHGYNIEVHFPSEKTLQRYQERKLSGKSKKKHGWQHVPGRGIPVPDPLRTEPDFTFNRDTGALIFSTEAGHSASICRDLAKFPQTDDDPVQRNEFLDSLSRSKVRRLQNWLTVNQPQQDSTVQNLFQQMILTLDSHQKSDSSHQRHGNFQSYDSTAPAEQEKKQRKKADAESVQLLKIPWRRNEMQQISIYTLINDPKIKEVYPLRGDDEVVKISYSLAVPNGVWLQNYGKVCQLADLDSPNPPEVPVATSCPCQQFRTESSIDFHGHVATIDPGFIKDERLRLHWLKGQHAHTFIKVQKKLLVKGARKRADAPPKRINTPLTAELVAIMFLPAHRKKKFLRTYSTYPYPVLNDDLAYAPNA